MITQLLLILIVLLIIKISRIPEKITIELDSRKHIYIIRHAEKYNLISGLSDIGMRRAYFLRSIFGNELHRPDLLYSYNYNDPVNCGTESVLRLLWKTQYHSGKYHRTTQTLLPLSEKYSIPINNDYGLLKNNGNKGVVKSILFELSKKDINTILVCWEHRNIKHLLSYFDLYVSWDRDDYSTILDVSFNSGIPTLVMYKMNNNVLNQ